MSAPQASRGVTGLAAAILAGGFSAAFLIVALLHANSMLIFMAYFAALPLYLAGLGAGALAGLVASMSGTAILYMIQPPNVSVLYAFAYAVPAILLSGLAMRWRMGPDQRVFWYPEGNLLTAITLYPCVLFLTALALASAHPGGLLDLTEKAFDQVAMQFAKNFPDDRAEAFHAAIVGAAKIAPALLAYTWIIVAIVSMAGAQYILRKQQWTLRTDFSLYHLHVPAQLIYGVAATGLLGVFGPAPYDYIGRNLSLILGLPFFFVGLAVVHAWAAGSKYKGFALLIFYIVLTLVPGMPVIAAALGVLDQWVDFRKRIDPKPIL